MVWGSLGLPQDPLSGLQNQNYLPDIEEICKNLKECHSSLLFFLCCLIVDGFIRICSFVKVFLVWALEFSSVKESYTYNQLKEKTRKHGHHNVRL